MGIRVVWSKQLSRIVNFKVEKVIGVVSIITSTVRNHLTATNYTPAGLMVFGLFKGWLLAETSCIVLIT